MSAVKPASKLCSQIIRKYLKMTVEQGAYLNGIPFTWNSKKNRVEIQQYKLRLFHWGVNLTVACGHIGFIFLRSAHIHFRNDVTMGEKVFMKFQATYFALSLILHIGVILNFKSIPRVVNMALDFADDTEYAYVTGDARKPFVTKIVELLLQSLFWALSVLHVLMTLAALAVPELPHLLSSFLANPYEISLTRFLCIAYVAYMEYLYHSSAGFIVLTFFPVVSPIMIILSELRPKSSSLTKPDLRYMKNTLKMFKKLAVLMASVNDAYASFIIPAAKMAIIITAAFCTYGAVRFSGLPAIALGTMGISSTSIILACFVSLAELHRRSSKVLRERRQKVLDQGGHQWVVRELRALREVKAVIGAMYFVDRRMVLTMVDTIFQEATGFLLLNR